MFLFTGISLEMNNNKKSYTQRFLDYPADSTEVIIERMVNVNYKQGGREEEEESTRGVVRINPAMKRHFELEIKTLKMLQQIPTN
jgi:hypothetical protein